MADLRARRNAIFIIHLKFLSHPCLIRVYEEISIIHLGNYIFLSISPADALFLLRLPFRPEKSKTRTKRNAGLQSDYWLGPALARFSAAGYKISWNVFWPHRGGLRTYYVYCRCVDW